MKKRIISKQLNINDLTRAPRHKRTSVWLKNARYKRPCHIRAYRALPLETVVEVTVRCLPNVAGFVVPAQPNFFMETDQDNKVSISSPAEGKTPSQISIGGGIIIGSIIVVLGVVSTQVLKQQSIDDQNLRNQVLKESLPNPYQDCLEKARNKHEVDVSFVRAIIDDELSQCTQGIRCARTTDEIMADLRRSMDSVDQELEAEEQRCIELYK